VSGFEGPAFCITLEGDGVVRESYSGAGLDPVPLERLVESALDHLTALADTATVETNLPAESVAVPRGPEPALIELIEKAIEHNSPPRRVRIEASSADGIRDVVTLEIADNGPGLSTDDRRVLEGGEERPLSHASSIGLWLARWACESVATDVSVHETDTGTVIRLEIPAKP
jgi:signal transduction histidine kinase